MADDQNFPKEETAPQQQEDQAQQQPPASQPSGGGISRGINNINNFARRGFSNPFGKIGQRVVGQTALRGFAAFLAGPGLPIVIVIVFVFIFTFIIVGFGGAPPPPETSPQTPSPTLPAQEPITPPVAP